jgi:4-carboxymuconolactone decarboxylase
MASAEPLPAHTPALDEATRALVRLSALIAVGSEEDVRSALDGARALPAAWVEEVILQSYLFAGLPRALNAAREWRRVSGLAAPPDDEGTRYDVGGWRARGEAVCRRVYGAFYERLRVNIRALHPALDAWMIVEGYGKVLARPGLDLKRRELCVVAACAAARQDRQLHSHLHGALHVGASAREVAETLDAVRDLVDGATAERHAMLWAHVTGSGR